MLRSVVEAERWTGGEMEGKETGEKGISRENSKEGKGTKRRERTLETTGTR